VSALSGIQDDASYFQMSVPILPGNSGGPVVNMHGEVVGIVTSTAVVEAFYALSGSLPQNVNWAPKSDYVRLMFDPRFYDNYDGRLSG
jgi:S1-C subfamily serine protease